MTFKAPAMVFETTTTTGTGTYTLGGAVTLNGTTFRDFATAVGNGNTCPYVCRQGSDFEVGIGTVTVGGSNTLARTAVLASSNGDAAVNWPSGTRNIYVDLPPEAMAALADTTQTGVPERTGALAWTYRAITAAGRSMIAAADAAAQRTLLSIGALGLLSSLSASNASFAAAQRLLGRNTAGAGTGEEVTLSQLLDWIGSAASGDILYRGASVWARLAKGSDGQYLSLAAGLPAWATLVTPTFAIFEHQTAYNAGGGSSVSGSFQTRTINTSVINGITGASLSANTITLPSGTYNVRWFEKFWGVAHCTTKLVNTADSTSYWGASGHALNINSGNDLSSETLPGTARFTIASSKTFQLQSRVENNAITNGYGNPNGFASGTTNVFASVFVEKTA